MKVLSNCGVKDSIELLYAKTILKNLLKTYKSSDAKFLEFATMELGNNLLKYAGGGYLWFVLVDEKVSIASVDSGFGIKDVAMACKYRYTSHENSLGLGLFSLSQHSSYRLDVISFCRENGDEFFGTTVLLGDISASNSDYCLLSSTLYDSLYSGDFFVKKGRHIFFGDVCGHGKKADETAQEIISFFNDNAVSCLSADDYFSRLHTHLIKSELRGFVGCIIVAEREEWSVCGVGNISIFSNESGTYKLHFLTDGIVGCALSKISSLSFSKENESRLIVVTDGVDLQRAMVVLERAKGASNEALCVALLHFSGTYDDKSVLILSQQTKENVL